MNKISITDLINYQPLEKVVIESLDLALYRLLVVIKGEEYLVTEANGTLFKRHSLMEVRELLEPFHIEAIVMRHQSAYDEMIGQPPKTASNMLEVPIARKLYPDPKTLH